MRWMRTIYLSTLNWADKEFFFTFLYIASLGQAWQNPSNINPRIELRALISPTRSNTNPRIGFELLSETQLYGQAINNLSKSSLHRKIMLRHSHVEKFLKVAQIKYDVIETKKSWKIVDKRNDYKLISLKWMFIYKFDSNDFLFKYKARIMIRDDLQKVNNAQNVYVTTFALKIFDMMMTFVVDFHFKIK
jgi:hypothetical protein